MKASGFCFLFLHLWLCPSYSQDKVLVRAVNHDTVIAVASNGYSDLPLSRRLLMGKNYRTTWSTPVHFPVFYLSKTQFKFESLGGSKQTYSLYLKDSVGATWVLRSVDKDVRKAYPGMKQWLPVVPFKQDLISANYPYAALVVADLMKSAHVPAPAPVYYFVADDTALGAYRAYLGNSICMLEKRDPTPDGSPAIDTDSFVKRVQEDTSCRILQQQLLKLRVLDMLIGDPDRHAGQFRWGSVDSVGVRYFYPIPRDRDFAFFSSGGALPFLLQIVAGRPQIHFTGSSKNLRKINHKCLEFDRTFLSGLGSREWEETAQEVLLAMSDEVIDAAVKKLPPEIYAIDGDVLAFKLKSRKKTLVQDVMEYYYFLFPQ